MILIAKILAFIFVAALVILVYIGVIMHAIAEASMRNAFKRDDGEE